MKILFDIGHNCYPDMGASAIGDENKMNIEVGTKVIAKLKALGHTVVNVTPSSASSVSSSLAQRVNKANAEGGDLYVAIHFNCGGGHGVEVWSGSQTSSSVAQKVLDAIVELGFVNRGVKIQGQNGYEHLYVLNNTSMPAILTEGCFVDSQSDMNLYNAESMANAIVEGLTGQAVQDQATVQQLVVKADPYPTYEETVPTGPNIYQIPGMPFYIEKRTDGDMSIHLDRGNYITLRKGGAPEVYWNNNKGAGESKRLF